MSAGFHNVRVKYLQIVTSTMKRITNKHADIHKYSKSIYLQDSWIMLFQKVRVAIFLLKHEIDLLSLIYCGMDFQIEAPSYIKLFFTIVRIWLWQTFELELSRRLWFNISVLKVNNSLSEFGPMLLSVLNISFALAFTLCCFSGSLVIYSVLFVDLPHLARVL